jgi:hypothetical protein
MQQTVWWSGGEPRAEKLKRREYPEQNHEEMKEAYRFCDKDYLFICGFCILLRIYRQYSIATFRN